LSRWAGHNVICVECIEGTRAVRTSFDPGQILPLHAGAPSKLLLAYAGPKDLDHYLSLPLEAFTAQTVVDLETLANQLRAIRDQGHCATESEVDIGVCDLAVPLLDSRQRVLAALSTSGPCFRMDGTVVDNHLDLLRQGAAAIQEQLVLISS
jgi:DNA-binding IclR family transcriptional regulator